MLQLPPGRGPPAELGPSFPPALLMLCREEGARDLPLLTAPVCTQPLFVFLGGETVPATWDPLVGEQMSPVPAA